MTENFIGTRVGHIRITGLLGEGGMGAVYAGFDEKLERQVALKAVREAQAGPEYRARFLREARMLSLLNHPNICQIYDYLEADGRDFLALELIEGRSLGQVIADRPDFATRMSIARQLVAVLVATHAKGIIHRDLKPGNVIVSDGGNVKVLDFGLAHAAEEPVTRTRSDLAAESPFNGVTQHGAIVGTLQYMSPEQARGEYVTTASDMYACGLILQELFTGVSAYQKEPSDADQISRARSGETAAVSGLDPDLTALIVRLKDPAPAVRPSAIDTRDRLSWIRDGPKRRLKRIALAATVGLSVLVGVVMAYQAYRVREEGFRANREAAAAQQITEFLVALFAVSDPSEARGNSITAREILDKGVARIEPGLAAQPETQARLMATMGDVYRGLGLTAQAYSIQGKALETRRLVLGGNHPDTLASLHKVGLALFQLGRHAEAERHLREALDGRRRVLGPDHDETTSSLNALGAALVRQGKRAEAEPYFRESYLTRRRLKGSFDSATLSSLINLGALLRLEGKFSEAQGNYQDALEAYRQNSDLDNPRALSAQYNLADLRLVQGDGAGAEQAYRDVLARQRRILGPEHPDALRTASNVGEALLAQHKLPEAEEQYQAVLMAQRRILTRDHPDLGITLKGIGEVQIGRSRYAEAERHLREAQDSRWNDPWHAAEVKSLLGHALARQGKFHDAESLLTQSYDEMAARPNLSRRRGQAAAGRRTIELYEALSKHEQAESWRARLAADSR